MRICLVQPYSNTGPAEEANVADAVSWVESAAGLGADLVVFPETYPGPGSQHNHYDPTSAMCGVAAKTNVHVIFSRIVPAEAGKHNIGIYLADDTGTIAGHYYRTVPKGPYIYRDIDVWDFDYLEAPQLPRVVETSIGRIGMLVCSEVYSPELSRILALQGADLIVYPAGGAQNELISSWRTMLQARASENLAYTAASQNLYSRDEKGLAIVSGPEGLIAQTSSGGILLADLDLKRLQFLRSEDERIESPRRYTTMPGVLRWPSRQLYQALYDTYMSRERNTDV